MNKLIFVSNIELNNGMNAQEINKPRSRREERQFLEIAQHHAPYRLSGSRILRTVANLSHREI